jgi:hypothetical protein
MESVGSISEHHMVLEFVRAEIDSLTFGPYYQFPAGWDRSSLLDKGDPTDPDQRYGSCPVRRDWSETERLGSRTAFRSPIQKTSGRT